MKSISSTIRLALSWERTFLSHILMFFIFPISLLLIFLSLIIQAAVAAPYIPENGDRVLEQLPASLTSLFSDKNNDVSDAGESLIGTEQWNNFQEKKISSYLKLAKASGDMRYVSYAENRLQQWLKLYPQSVNARFLKAQIQQYNHNFKAAILNLELITKQFPREVKAWSLLANLQLLTGDYSSAKASCNQLSIRGSLADTLICQSNIMLRVGDLDKSNKILKALLPMMNNMSAQRQVWLYTSLVEINIQHGHYKQADNYINKAMQLISDNNIVDNYLTRLYADYLVQNNKFKKAFELIKDKNNDSSMMIRSAVIAKKLGDNATYYMRKLALTQLFDVEKRRGGSQHLREQALFTLLILNKPGQAYQLARKNWALQKEPEDARIFLKAALATGDKINILNAQKKIKITGLVDQRLDVHHLRESII